MGSLRLSLALSFAQRYSEFALRVVATIAIARLLTPTEIGAFAVVAAVAAVAQLVCGFGVQGFIVQARELPRSLTEAAAGLTVTASLTLGAVFVLAALIAPSLPGGATLAPLILILAAALALIGPAVPALGLLQRDMRFGALYWAGTARAATSAAVGIGLAAAGAGPASLAWACVAENLALLVVCSVQARPLVRPRFAPRQWPEMVRFGGYTTANSAMKMAGDAAPGIAAGHVLGLAATGLLSRAQALIGMFDQAVVQGLAPVLMPFLADRVRRGDALGPSYVAKTSMLSGLAWPAFAAIALTAPALLRVLLGPQWDAAALPARILCLTGLVLPFNAANLGFFVVLGLLPTHTRRQGAVQLAKMGAVVVAAAAGLEAIAATIVAAEFVRFAVAQHLLTRHLTYSGTRLGPTLLRSAAVTAATAGAVWAAQLGTAGAAPWLELVAAGLAGATTWTAAIVLVGHPLRVELHRLIGYARGRNVPAAS